MTIEVKKTNVNNELKFISNSYKLDGFVLNTDEVGLSELLLVNKNLDYVTFICIEEHFLTFSKKEKRNKKQDVKIIEEKRK